MGLLQAHLNLQQPLCLHFHLQRLLASVGNVALHGDTLAADRNDVVFCIVRLVLRRVAAMEEAVILDADIFRRRNENGALRNVAEDVVVNVDVFVHTGGIFDRVAVVARFEDDRALVGTAFDVSQRMSRSTLSFAPR